MTDDSKPDLLRGETFDGADAEIYAPMLIWWRRTSAKLGRLPTRKDLRPESLPPQCLPHIMITEILPNAERLRFRLFGGAHVTFNQRDFTGQYLEEVNPNKAEVAYLTGLHRELQKIQRPLWSVNQVTHPRTAQRLTVYRLMLPLATNGIEVDLSLGVQTFESQTFERQTGEGACAVRPVSPEAGERVRRFL